MKTFFSLTLAFVLTLPAATTVYAQPQAGRSGAAFEEIDRIIAVVNDDVITASQLQTKLKSVRRQLAESNTRLPPENVLERQVLERLVMTELQLQIARRIGVQVDETTLNNTLRQIAKRNGLTLAQFREVLERDGVNFNAFREDLREELILSRLHKRQVENRINVSQREIDNYLATLETQAGLTEEYHLGHILIAVPEAANPERIAKARAKAEEILTQLRAGADFRQTAVAVSDGQNALKGGDVGWRQAGQLPTLFSDIVITMAPGELSNLIRSPSGFHIVTVFDKRGEQSHVVSQTHVRHILIKTDELTSDQEAQTRLEQLQRRIKGGSDFSELARSHSEDPGSAGNGGDLGWVSPGDLVPEFQQVMDQLDSNEISEPFRSRFGWHIVQVLDRRDYDNTDEYRKSQARNVIFKRKRIEEMAAWLRRIRDEAYVEYRLDS